MTTFPHVPAYKGDGLVLMERWKGCGGNWHGPNVETVTMPLSCFGVFINNVEEAAASKALAADKAARMSDMHR